MRIFVLVVSISACIAASARLADAQAIASDALNRQAREVGNEIFRDRLGPAVQNALPFVSSSTSFTFRFNHALDVWERTPQTSGPIFLERADAVGAGHWDFTASYGYVRFSQVNGRSLFSGLRKRDCTGSDTACPTFIYRIRSAEAQFATFGSTYGVTDDLDLSILVPVERVYIDANFTLDPAVLPDSAPARRDHFGIGDIALRAKWRALGARYVNAAAGLELQVPSGDRERGLGTGDTRLTPALYLSKDFRGWFEPHVNVGVETNLATLRDSRLPYGFGVTCEAALSTAGVVNGVGVTVDVLGRADLTEPHGLPRNTLFGRPRQTHTIDLAPGVKITVLNRGVIFAALLLPLNDDGLRADLTPVGGIEIPL